MRATLEREQTLATLASEAHGPEDPRVQELLRTILEILSPSLTLRGITQWFESPSQYLGNQTPIDLVAQGRFSKVLEAAEAFDQGVYL